MVIKKITVTIEEDLKRRFQMRLLKDGNDMQKAIIAFIKAYIKRQIN